MQIAICFSVALTPLPDNRRHSQERDIHAPSRIPTRNPRKQEVVNPSLGSRGHWDYVNLYRKYNNQDLKISFSAWQLVPHWADSSNRQS